VVRSAASSAVTRRGSVVETQLLGFSSHRIERIATRRRRSRSVGNYIIGGKAPVGAHHPGGQLSHLDEADDGGPRYAEDDGSLCC
jgi:hypothetical protein